MNKLFLGCIFFIATASAFIRPLVEGGHDASVYLELMQVFLDNGIAYPLYREPLYPLFLAFLKRCGLSPVQVIAPIQNVLFFSCLFFFLKTLVGKASKKLLTISFCITLIPTFFITLNGALYTESLSTSLIFLFLAFLLKFYCTRRFIFLVCAALCSALLVLCKGSFIYVHFFFPFVLLLFLFKKKRVLSFVLLLIGLGIFNKAVVSLWFGLREQGVVFSQKVYTRGGAIFYGRTEYANRFDFFQDTPIYVLNAFSESTCKSIFGHQCEDYNFVAENNLGFYWFDLNNPHRISDEELFKKAEKNIFDHPIRQVFFCGYELLRFVFHHSTNGFARLEILLVGDLIHSLPFTVFLKIFNLFLYLYIPVQCISKKRQFSNFKNQIQAWPDSIKVGTLLYIAYSISLLCTHGFVTTLVRMCYPVAPFLVVLNWQAYRIFSFKSMPD